ncbi:MAG: serine/threonine protein kinase [Planctomycetes bacterium]|nr:serine/threonine protein kinase [Planctomycetota bacterium]MBL7007927.1 serine/threonine protein kinase [Planctomycetota bacterium]
MSASRTHTAFDAYLQALRSGEDVDQESFLRAQPSAIRSALGRLIQDYHALLDGSPSAPGALEPGHLLGGYRLIRRLGQGGMGSVWLAEETALKRQVALKLLKPEFCFSPLLLQRFQREAEAAGRLHHSGIVQVYAVGETDGQHWIAQELVAEGRNLAGVIERSRQHREPFRAGYCAVARLFQQVAEALQHAHDAGVIHRDLKPSNILLTGTGEPKVADFGLAKMEDQLGLSRTGDVSGTPYYMSPEQAAGRRMGLDQRSDVFSLGATLYEALTLCRAFDGDTGPQVIQKILTEDPVDPRRLRSRVPKPLALICLKCLEKNPERRYPSMTALAEDLGRFLGDQPVLAKPPGQLQRGAKWARRHPVTSVTAAVVTLALAVISILLVEVRAERDAVGLAAAAAEREAATAEETLGFLIGLFEESDPALNRGRQVTVREVLDRGAERIRDELADQPQVRIRLLDSIGGVYSAMGEFELAEPFLTESVERTAALFGEDDPETHGARNNLTMLYHDLGRPREAELLYRQALDGFTRHYRPDHKFTLTLRNNLGLLLSSLGRHEEAEQHLLAVLEADRRLFGPGHDLTLTAMNNVADLYRMTDRLEEAEALMRQAWQGLAARHGPDYPNTLSSLDGLGVVLFQLGRLEEAEECLVQANQGFIRVLDAEHPDLLTSEKHLGMLREEQRRMAARD